jgi:predicted outer membrane protein
MKRLALTVAGVFAAMLAVCAAATAPEEAAAPQAPILSSEMSGADLVFFTGAARQTALLARLSELAKGRAVTPEVQAVAAGVWKEQTDAAARLKELAGREHVPLPEAPDGLGKKQLQTLAKLKGAKFDKSYLDALGDAQDLLETSLEAGAASMDKEIKAFAEAGLATLKEERERVKKLGM